MSDRSYNRLRHVTKSEKKRLRIRPGEPWAPMIGAMYESPAYSALTLAARKTFERLLVEHINHAGHENGRLKVSFDDFEKSGIDRHSIRPALDELEALGFVRCSIPGRRAYGPDPGRIACYRLTMFSVLGGDDTQEWTDEWKSLSKEEVQAIQAKLQEERAVKKGRKGRKPHQATLDDRTVVPFRISDAA